MNVLDWNEPQPSNGKCNIQVFFIRKYVGKNFSYAALLLYICTLEQVKKDHFTIITAILFNK